MKKWINLVFCILFLVMLFCPLLSMDLRQNQTSEIDNSYLPEITPALILENGLSPTLEEYVNKRIGYRFEALDIYQEINEDVFGLLEHPSYMYGSDDYVYFKGDKFVHRYQHRDLDQEEADSFAQALAGFQAYANSKGKSFLYWLLPDKETIYPEHYPDSINSLGDLSYTDQVLNALSKYDVRHHFGKDAMLSGKESMLVNNIKYDAGHWNQNGAFVSCQNLYSVFQQFYPNILPISQDDFIIDDVVQPFLDTSKIEINEYVPRYTLKESHAENKTEWLWDHVFFSFPNHYATHYVNAQQSDMPKILFFSDSYLGGNEKFFKENFSQAAFIHRYNCVSQDAFEYYVDILDPDIIVFENPERSLPIDLYQEFNKP